MWHEDGGARPIPGLVLGEGVSPLKAILQGGTSFEGRSLGSPDVIPQRGQRRNGLCGGDEAARGTRDLKHGAEAR